MSMICILVCTFDGLYGAVKRNRLWGVMTFLSIWVAQCPAYDVSFLHPLDNRYEFLGAKTPPNMCFRGDEAGTALDLLQQIEDHQYLR